MKNKIEDTINKSEGATLWWPSVLVVVWVVLVVLLVVFPVVVLAPVVVAACRYLYQPQDHQNHPHHHQHRGPPQRSALKNLEIMYAHIEILVTFLLVNFFGFLVTTRHHEDL